MSGITSKVQNYEQREMVSLSLAASDVVSKIFSCFPFCAWYITALVLIWNLLIAWKSLSDHWSCCYWKYWFWCILDSFLKWRVFYRKNWNASSICVGRVNLGAFLAQQLNLYFGFWLSCLVFYQHWTSSRLHEKSISLSP